MNPNILERAFAALAFLLAMREERGQRSLAANIWCQTGELALNDFILSAGNFAVIPL
jgi:hypothetical protein